MIFVQLQPFTQRTPRKLWKRNHFPCFCIILQILIAWCLYLTICKNKIDKFKVVKIAYRTPQVITKSFGYEPEKWSHGNKERGINVIFSQVIQFSFNSVSYLNLRFKMSCAQLWLTKPLLHLALIQRRLCSIF